MLPKSFRLFTPFDATVSQPTATSAARAGDRWPFDDSQTLAVITLDRVINGAAYLSCVSHDGDDGGWQFLDDGDLTEDNAMIISLCEVAAYDSTIRELFDLPVGWYAVRDDLAQPWKRYSAWKQS